MGLNPNPRQRLDPPPPGDNPNPRGGSDNPIQIDPIRTGDSIINKVFSKKDKDK
jgi:hypothetical protein